MPISKRKSGEAPRDNWRTPQALWDKLNDQYHFVFDCCADETNAKTGWWTGDFARSIDSEDLARIGTYGGVLWMNPPFSKAKDLIPILIGTELQAVVIYRCDTMETALWQTMLARADWVFIPKGRVRYEGQEGVSPMFPSALVGFGGVEPPNNIEGRVLMCKQGMTPNRYQELAARTDGTTNDRDRLTNASMGLSGEAGEFTDAVKKHLFHGHALDKQKLSKEIGDLLWYCAQAARALGTDLETVMVQNIEKLKKRYPEGFSSEASIARRDVNP